MPIDIPPREHSHLNLQAAPSPEDRLCPGCKRSAVNEQGGLVVAFGQSFFHVDCFKCAKCRNQVTADTNLLLLSDGSPICANCSYSCNICRKPILDEAIMTGDDSYHAHCFKCKVCHNRIDELVFAKTSQGIYCMNCHNERMIKIRKHAQKKAERERANAANSSSSRSRDTDPRHSNSERRDTGSRPSDSPRPDSAVRSTAKSPQGPYVADAFDPSTNPGNSSSQRTQHPTPPPVTIAPPHDTTHSNSHQPLSIPSKSNTLPIPPLPTDSGSKRRSSYDDGLRPFNTSDTPNLQPSNQPESLSVTPRRDKRRSINPGLSLSPFKDLDSRSSSPRPIPLNSSLSRERSGSHSSRADSLHSYPLDDVSKPGTRQPSPDDEDNTIVLTSPPVELDPVHSAASDHRSFHSSFSNQATLSPTDPNGFRRQKRFSSNSLQSDRTRSTGPSRSASPAYRADVPHGVESGTDTEPENEFDNPHSGHKDNSPPALPPKDKTHSIRSSLQSEADADLETSESSQGGDEPTESPPVEQTSHPTFIAPALPPIRFSMTPADFSELLTSVGGLPALKALDNISKPPQQETIPATPPPTASSIGSHLTTQANGIDPPQLTPTGSDTVLPQRNGKHLPDDVRTITPEHPAPNKTHSPDPVITRLRHAVESARDRGVETLKLDIDLVKSVLDLLDERSVEHTELKHRLDSMNRTSKQYIDGLTVAQVEYDRELKARRDAEAEVTRLRVLLSGQAVRLTALSGDTKKQELRQQLTKEINDNLSGLEHDLSRLKVERDLTVAEMEEISATKRANGNSAEIPPQQLSRSLTKRLDNIRSQYQRELVPLTEQKEALVREIAELKSVRDVFLEETTVLNARNEELAQLSAVYARRLENSEAPVKQTDLPRQSQDHSRMPASQSSLIAPSLSTSPSSSSSNYDESLDTRTIKMVRSDNDMHTPAKAKFKWPGSKPKETSSPTQHFETSKGKAHIEHNFQQLSVLRFTRCDHCGDKMWGSQLRCTVCAISIHVRCIANVHVPCNHNQQAVQPESQNTAPLPISMFGRDLVEQVKADDRGDDRAVPVLVEKCIEAVEERALDYEGIYRKTGGLGQSKAITQLFEKGDYESFDLCDNDRFNDICSVTSVLKTYFRSLPIPLLTFDLHDQFTTAIQIRDLGIKHRTLVDLINNLPREHYFTLRLLMLHLNRIKERSDRNLMNARNLGVVFGPTLMRSKDPAAEFSDMAGKALFIEWLVDNAPQVFNTT